MLSCAVNVGCGGVDAREPVDRGTALGIVFQVLTEALMLCVLIIVKMCIYVFVLRKCMLMNVWVYVTCSQLSIHKCVCLYVYVGGG